MTERSDRTYAFAGMIATLYGLAVTEAAAGVFVQDSSLFTAVGNQTIRILPGPVVTLAIGVFGPASRILLVAVMSVTIMALGAALGLAVGRRSWAVAAVGFGGFSAVAAAVGARDPSLAPVPAAGLTAAGACSGAIALWVLLRARDPRPSGARPDGAEVSRRAFLSSAAVLAGASTVLLTSGRVLLTHAAQEMAKLGLALPGVRYPLPPSPPDLAEEVGGLSRLFTPTISFFRIDTALTVPRIDLDSYRLRVAGMVGRPLELTYTDVVQRADREVDVTLVCVSNEVGGDLVGTARWTGFPLARLLDEAGRDPAADQIVGRAVDGWTAGFPTAAAYDGRDALVAIGMNGEPLPPRHGFPVRLVVAGLYGYVSDTKWLTEVELTTWGAYDAYWIPRGWAKHAPIRTQSRIDVPRPGAELPPGLHVIAGVAWAGIRGIRAVQVRIDDAPWEEAELGRTVGPATWRQWVHPWEASAGEHDVSVRAVDGSGEVQTAARSSVQPSGATGHHTITVKVHE